MYYDIENIRNFWQESIRGRLPWSIDWGLNCHGHIPGLMAEEELGCIKGT